MGRRNYGKAGKVVDEVVEEEASVGREEAVLISMIGNAIQRSSLV